ncbi:hypothetical protein M0G43_05450 [Subsaxibacter sp. CAU 1640]|uniref:hypothetical protein n=1 Tax=Subsaxibacter sp. CAU 1640 TaxID=2933271 RepID=UPI002002E5B8|nr:hypothetical protein [Subsaxibacter sp. CAU 1640]MCK7590013.1 hypothetical protein [Subsaxibacter sp. CAU 1640]
MKENVDKHIEQLVGKVMKKSTLESPSLDFTANVMSQLESSKQSLTTVYKPLITKRVWALIAVVFISFLVYTVFVNKPETSDWFNRINFNEMNLDKISNVFSQIKAPKTAAYIVGVFAMMLLVQLTFLKNYFDKRFEG